MKPIDLGRPEKSIMAFSMARTHVKIFDKLSLSEMQAAPFVWIKALGQTYPETISRRLCYGLCAGGINLSDHVLEQ